MKHQKKLRRRRDWMKPPNHRGCRKERMDYFDRIMREMKPKKSAIRQSWFSRLWQFLFKPFAHANQ